MRERSLVHSRSMWNKRSLVHDRITSAPGPGESPETVLESAVIKLWSCRVRQQQAWLEDRDYKTAEAKIIIEDLHASLSPQALEFLSWLITDAEFLEYTIRHTPLDLSRPGSGYNTTGGTQRPQKISQKRFINFLIMHQNITESKAKEIAEELHDFSAILVHNSESR